MLQRSVLRFAPGYSQSWKELGSPGVSLHSLWLLLPQACTSAYSSFLSNDILWWPSLLLPVPRWVFTGRPYFHLGFSPPIGVSQGPMPVLRGTGWVPRSLSHIPRTRTPCSGQSQRLSLRSWARAWAGFRVRGLVSVPRTRVWLEIQGRSRSTGAGSRMQGNQRQRGRQPP